MLLFPHDEHRYRHCMQRRIGLLEILGKFLGIGSILRRTAAAGTGTAAIDSLSHGVVPPILKTVLAAM